MRKINEGIVFSNDIGRILKGNNALGFNYNDNGIIIPNDNTIDVLRENFLEDTSRIFDKVSIIEENEMLLYMYQSIMDVYRRYPHCFIR